MIVRRRPHRSSGLARLVVAAGAAMAWWMLTVGAVFAASPTPAAGGDPRSSGQGPGLVGDPAFAILAVLAIGIGAFAITLAYVRMTGGRRA